MNSVIPFAIGFICGLICLALILRREENRWLKRMYRKAYRDVMKMMETDEEGKMMTIDEAIKHAKEVAGDSRCTECAKEIAKQLASWLEELKELREKSKWIPCSERLPEDESYILVLFENFTIPDIARYEENDEGGTFYPEDDEKSYLSYGLFVNAWMELPEPYREDE